MKPPLTVIKEDELPVIKKTSSYENVTNNNCLSSGNINLLAGKWKFSCLIPFQENQTCDAKKKKPNT